MRKEERILGECNDKIKELQTKYKEEKALILPLLKPVEEKNKVDESSEAQNYQKESVNEQDVDQIDPVVQQLKDLESNYKVNYNELMDKKGQISARVTALRDQQTALQTKRETLAKEKETFEQELRDKEEQVNKEEPAIVSIKEKIEAQAEENATLEAKLKQLLLNKQQKQDEADTYALIKYLTLLNIYSALPNDDFDYHGYENPLTTLSFAALPTIRQMVNSRARKVSIDNVEKAVKRETQKFTAAVDKHMQDANTELSDKFLKSFKALSSYNGDFLMRLADAQVKKVHEEVTGAKVAKLYTTNNKDQYCYYPQDIKDDAAFQDHYSDLLNLLRADHQIKASMANWRGKISTAAGSLVQRLGLDSALFNPDFSITSYPYLLSFTELKTRLEGTSLASYPARLKEKDVWSLARMQLKTNFFEAMTGKDEKVWRRISPLVRFVENKLTTHAASKVAGSAASSTATKLPLEETKQNGFKHLLKLDEEKKVKAVEYAYLKYISYVNMLYALRYDGEGTEMPPLKIIDSVLEPLLREALPIEVRLDNVMAAKAYKWGLRVQDYGKEFIQKNGFLAHIFTPAFEDKTL